MKYSKSMQPDTEADPQIEPLLNEHQFARITNSSVSTARRNRILKKGCPFVKLGALVRYRLEDVRKFIESNVRGAEVE
jgi:hypothetical protein